MNWLDLAVLALLVVAYVGLHLLRRRRVNFSLLTLLALAIGIPIGLVGRGHAEYIEPIGRIYINILLAVVGPLIAVALISSIVSLGSLEKLRTIGLRSTGWLLLSNAIAVVLALGVGLASGTGSGLNETVGGQQLNVLENSVQNFRDVVIGFFPNNVVGDFGANHIIPIILISVTIAVATWPWSSGTR